MAGRPPAWCHTASLPPLSLSLSLSSFSDVVAGEGYGKPSETNLPLSCVPPEEKGLRPLLMCYSFFFVVRFHVLNPARSGLANLDASHSKPQVDNVTLRRLLVPKYVKV